MPVTTPDGHQRVYTAFDVNSGLPAVLPLLQLFPASPAVLTHVTVTKPLDRKDWLHRFPDGLQLPSFGVLLAPVPQALRPVAPAGPARPCPGVSQGAVGNNIFASDTMDTDTISLSSTFFAMTPDGPGAAASSRPNTSGRKYSTDAQGWVASIWSRGWCAPLDHSTVAPLPVPCSLSAAPCACSLGTLRGQEQKCPPCHESAKAYRKRVVHEDASHNPEFTKSVEVYAGWLREKSAEEDKAYAWGMYENECMRAAKEAKDTAAHSVDLRLLSAPARVRGYPRCGALCVGALRGRFAWSWACV